MNLTSLNKKRLLIITGILVVLTALILIFGRNDAGEKPVISSDSDILQISVKATEKSLLKGLTAMDEEDGDLTKEILVESISDFSANNTRTVTYAVMDSDLNVSKFQRKLKYTDYYKTRFTLSVGPVFPVGSSADLLPYLKAYDCIDGNITGNIRLVSSDVKSTQPGTYTNEYAVTNSCGDVSTIEIPITITQSFTGTNPVKLGKYITYIKSGQSVNYDAFITQAPFELVTEKSGDFGSDGVCYVDYKNSDSVFQRLIVVVE